MLDDALHLLACPHCAAPLSRSEHSVACANGHSFDVARSGYVSLLPGDAELGSADTAEMVAAREAFLGAGHFQPLAKALGEAAERAGLAGGAERADLRSGAERAGLPTGEPAGCVVDLGAGTGWYLARLLDRLPDRDRRDRPSGRVGLALDLSKHALRRAARAHARIAAVACDVWRPLPVRDSAADLVLCVFAPRNGPEIARVLRPAGALIVVTPTERHLAELVEEHRLLTVDERKQERLAATLDPHLDGEHRYEREWSLELTANDVANAVAMGPSARHVTRRVRGQATRVTASVTISIYRGRSG